MFKQIALFVLFLMILTACEQNLQQPVLEYSQDNPAQAGSRFPSLSKDNTGKIYMSWLANIEEEVYALQYTELIENRWGEPSAVHVDTDFFVNWADFPDISGYGGNPLALHRLKKIEGGPYAYNVELIFKEGNTGRWTQLVTPHLDGTATEHGFVSHEPINGESLLAIWLDGRNTEGRGHHQYEDIEKAMTLRSAEVTKEGEINRSREIDSVVCDCCQTDLAKVEGGFIAVYRGRDANEKRDIRISKYSMETGEWSEPAYVYEDGWEIGACPVNGPRIVADGEHVAVAWYTGADDESVVKVTRSANGGESFDEPVIVAGTDLNTLGRVDLIMSEEGNIYVSWLQGDQEYGYVIITKISFDGQDPVHRHVGTTTSSRLSGFPRIIKAGDGIIAAWTQTEPFYRVRTAYLPFQSFNQKTDQ